MNVDKILLGPAPTAEDVSKCVAEIDAAWQESLDEVQRLRTELLSIKKQAEVLVESNRDTMIANDSNGGNPTFWKAKGKASAYLSIINRIKTILE